MKKSRKKTTRKARKSGHRYFLDVFAILLITFAVLAILSVLDFHSEDWPNGTSTSLSNRLGQGGAYVSNVLVQYTFGKVFSLSLPLILLLLALSLLLRKGLRLILQISSILLNVAVIGATTTGVFLLPHADTWIWCGLIGYELAHFLVLFLGRTGAIILMSSVIFIFISLLLRIRWAKVVLFQLTLANKIFHGLQSFWKSMIHTGVREEVQEAPSIVKKPHSEENSGKTEQPISEGIETQQKKLSAAETSVQEPAVTKTKKDSSQYSLPTPELLIPPDPEEDGGEISESLLKSQANQLEETFEQFNISASVVRINPGPVITRYDLRPAPGTKLNKIVSLADDITMALKARAVRILAPIPGEGAVGVEVPNPITSTVRLHEIVSSSEFMESMNPLTIALGKNAQGEVFVTDLAKMPHLLIAGTTGSGKSVCINAIITSLLLRNRPEEVLICMIDPKKIELSIYSELRRQHLLFLDDLDEVIATEPKNAVLLLKSVVQEMEHRYDSLAETGARSIIEYNQQVERGMIQPDDEGNNAVKLPYIVVIIDELADLMLTAAREVEEPIARLAQMARAVGIHLVVATQRPSVDVITGVIKANFPARMAFMVATKIDSRTILDRPGAEALLGRGDSLFLTSDSPFPVRIHGALITTDEVHAIVKHVVRQPAFVKSISLKLPESVQSLDGEGDMSPEARDSLFEPAGRLVIRYGQGSVSLIQRKLKVGYSRAGRILDQLEQAGVVGPFEGSKAREVLMDDEEFEALLS